MKKSLDSLLDSVEPDATFHDASLLELRIDFGQRLAELSFDLCVGDPKSPDVAVRERRRRGRLKLVGLHFWVVEPPGTGLAEVNSMFPWLTADGPLSEATSSLSRELSAKTPTSATGWYLFFSNWNAFAYFAADNITFSWG